MAMTTACPCMTSMSRRQPVRAICLAAIVWLAAAGMEDGMDPKRCNVAEDYTDMQLMALQRDNCGKVQGAIQDFELAMAAGKVSRELVEVWREKAYRASGMCNRSFDARDNYTAAVYAVNAWSEGIMGFSQCCNLVRPPYCLNMESTSLPTFAVGMLICVFMLLFAGTACASCLTRPVKIDRLVLEEEAPLALESARVRLHHSGDMASELRHWWLNSHCLRALPHAEEYAQTSASIFAGLREKFDFQRDSVRNQYEHLLSLWRSHCSTVADRAVQQEEEVDEQLLLAQALDELHTELLEGFMLWRAKLSKERKADSQGFAHGDVVAARQLEEIAAFLLVWGESGNVRFMPEVMYFITELVLTAESSTPDELYGIPPPAMAVAADRFHSNLFLAQVIRPIYNVVFDEWYDSVYVDPLTGKDQKKLRQGFDSFLPPDAANYDDWNELFCDPRRLVEGIALDDGTRLFDKPSGQRFAALRKVDWTVSLDRYETKTHREVHSLWGAYASTHRIWLLHTVLFACGVCLVAGDRRPSSADMILLQGKTAAVRFSSIGLLVPFHGALWTFACWITQSHTALRWNRTPRACISAVGQVILCTMPLVTYSLVRSLEVMERTMFNGWLDLDRALTFHFLISVSGMLSQLLAPGRECDKLWELTQVPWHKRCLRYLFWLAVISMKFLVSVVILQAVDEEVATLDLVRLGRQSLSEILLAWSTPSWGVQVLEWLLLWCTAFFLFVADTGVYYQIGCTVLGVPFIFARRQQFAIEDSLRKIPERFSQKVLSFSFSAGRRSGNANASSPWFPMIWDRIVEHMRYGDKCSSQAMMKQSFTSLRTGTVEWSQLVQPLRCGAYARVVAEGPASGGASGRGDRLEEGSETTADSSSDNSSVKTPDLFQTDALSFVRMGSSLAKKPENSEMRWRINSLARAVGMPMPSPYRAPYIPGITVLIPHANEDILVSKEALYTGDEETVPLMDWVKARYADEFDSFTARMQDGVAWRNSQATGSNWEAYSDQQWEDLSMWASMRLQTLWRTVDGISLYHAVLQCHHEAQGDDRSALAQPQVWQPRDCFTCLVSMQLYKTFGAAKRQQTNRMFETFPDSLQVAFLDWADKSIWAEAERVHRRQQRRYFSCLIDKHCEVLPGGERKPRLRIELPGFPILGDGKSDNQNHAIPFTRGVFCQCVDANQGAYFEQMLLLPCVLGEFRTRHRGDSQAKRIIGLPEHITSDFGSVGDFAAGSEMAFGTVLQRSHAILGARMHYGHPDIMNKQFMIQQGGVSKATKTLNLSEDIFAGMDFMLRGDGRRIRHCEYFYLTKGRDLGFNAVMGFFSKISSGAGEQILTRQMFRLGQILPLPEALSFYYAHAGYYLTHAFLSWSMPMTVFSWLLVLSAGCEAQFKAFMHCPDASAAEAVASVLSAWCSWVLVFFLFAQTLPLFTQMWMEMGFATAVKRFLKQWATCSWCFFIFQAKLVGFHMINEIRYGGATYISTGRGLPTQRRAFIGRVDTTSGRIQEVGGLYLDYAVHTFYDGMKLLVGVLLVLYMGGLAGVFVWLFIGLTVFSWLYAPFLFNPYQFSKRYFKEDLWSWWAFFFRDGSQHWVAWYDRTQLKPRRGFRQSVWDIKCFLAVFVLAIAFSIVNLKSYTHRSIYSSSASLRLESLILFPPIFSAAIYCILAAVVECVCARICKPAAESARQLGGAVCASGGDQDSSNSEATRASGQTYSCCASGMPLVLSAVVVVAAQAVEIVAPLWDLHVHGWHRAVVAGIILKGTLLSLVVFMSEGVLKSRFFGRIGVFGKPVDIFVHSNRLAKDIFTSAFIFCTLAIGVLLDAVNDFLCPAFNAHQLLVYRARPLRPDLV